MMSLVERYRDYYRDAGLFADNLMWLIMDYFYTELIKIAGQ